MQLQQFIERDGDSDIPAPYAFQNVVIRSIRHPADLEVLGHLLQ